LDGVTLTGGGVLNGVTLTGGGVIDAGIQRYAGGEARATQLLLVLVQANEARPAQQDAERFGDADQGARAALRWNSV
jgi:hypothetical protein